MKRPASSAPGQSRQNPHLRPLSPDLLDLVHHAALRRFRRPSPRRPRPGPGRRGPFRGRGTVSGGAVSGGAEGLRASWRALRLRRQPMLHLRRQPSSRGVPHTLPHSCACHGNPGIPSPWAKESLPAPQTRRCWIPVKSTGVRAEMLICRDRRGRAGVAVGIGAWREEERYEKPQRRQPCHPSSRAVLPHSLIPVFVTGIQSAQVLGLRRPFRAADATLLNPCDEHRD